LKLLAHADSVVADLDADRDCTILPHIAEMRAIADGPALRRVFDRVGEKIEHDLIDAQLVEQRHARLGRSGLHFKVQVFLLAERPNDRVNIVGKLLRRIGLRMQLDPLALRLGHVEHVVDEIQQKL